MVLSLFFFLSLFVCARARKHNLNALHFDIVIYKFLEWNIYKFSEP